MKEVVLFVLQIIVNPLILLFSPIFYLAARTGIGIRICRKMGFQPILIHYYQPIPDYELIPDSFFTNKQNFPGFSIDTAIVRTTLENISTYSSECNWPNHRTTGNSYYSQNMSFGYSSAALLHSIIRYYKTKKVMEIGSGFSSKITFNALKTNYPDNDFKLICIEPFPAKSLENYFKTYPGQVELLKRKVEEINTDEFLQLNDKDILFIDSSHVSKLNSDVNYIYLQVLPRLKSGVIIHIHDIYIPYEYPKIHFHGRQKIFWNEQYILQAFLTNNHDFEIIFPGFYVQTEMQNDFQMNFPRFNPQIHRPTSSFWLRKV